MLPTDYLVTAKMSTTLRALLSKFATTDVDRIYVVDEDSHPIGVVSNDELIRILGFKA